MDEAGLVTTTDRDAFQQILRVGRLQKLRRLGLAEELRPGHWRLEEGLEDTLRRMGERSDIIKRSEEHTSELQSLIRISYAVFCLNKNKINQAPPTFTHA